MTTVTHWAATLENGDGKRVELAALTPITADTSAAAWQKAENIVRNGRYGAAGWWVISVVPTRQDYTDENGQRWSFNFDTQEWHRVTWDPNHYGGSKSKEFWHRFRWTIIWILVIIGIIIGMYSGFFSLANGVYD